MITLFHTHRIRRAVVSANVHGQSCQMHLIRWSTESTHEIRWGTEFTHEIRWGTESTHEIRWGTESTHKIRSPRLDFCNITISLFDCFLIYFPQLIHLCHYYNRISLLYACTFVSVSRGYLHGATSARKMCITMKLKF